MPIGVSQAKQEFARLVRESSERYRVFTVRDAQRRDAKAALIIGEELMDLILSEFTCSPSWEEDPEQRLWTVSLPEIEVWGQGATREEAADDLVDAAIECAEVYMDDVPFYLKVGRERHLPYLLRIYRAGTDRAAIRRALGL